MSDNPNHIDQRLSRLEATVESLAANVNTIAQSIQSLSQSNKTNWGQIFSGVGLLVLIISSLGYLGIAKPQADTNAALISFMKEYREHVNNGHPYTVIAEIKLRNEAQDKTISKIEERLTDREKNAFTQEEADREFDHVWDRLEELGEELGNDMDEYRNFLLKGKNED